jgi:hypothetical protein
VDCEIEFEARITDESFSHAFGIEKRTGVEVDEVLAVWPDGDLTRQIAYQLPKGISRKRARHWARGVANLIERELEVVEVDKDDLYDAACTALSD